MDALNGIVAAVVVVTLIAAVTVLTWHGAISGEAAIAFFGTLGGGGAVAGVSHVATKTGARAATRTLGE